MLLATRKQADWLAVVVAVTCRTYCYDRHPAAERQLSNFDFSNRST